MLTPPPDAPRQFDVFPDDLGWALAVATDGHLAELSHFDAEDDAHLALRGRHPEAFHDPGAAPLPALREQLRDYLAGRRRDFDLPLAPLGTEFQRAVWHQLSRIPFGETRSYADVARAVGRPRGFQAVGQANHRNPLGIVVPCHRVIAADGTLGGYAGGLDRKRRLLRLEGVEVQQAIAW